MSNRLEDNDNQSTTSAAFNRSVYPPTAPTPQATHLMQPTPIPFQPNPYQWDMYYWNMYYAQANAAYAAQAQAEMVYREEMSRKQNAQYQNNNNNNNNNINTSQLNSTMIEAQRQTQTSTSASMPPLGMPSHLPPPTPFFSPYGYTDPYMGYGQMYGAMPHHSLLAQQTQSNIYPLPPQTPIHNTQLLDTSQHQKQIEQQQQQQYQFDIKPTQQELEKKQLQQNIRNQSTSSFKHEEIELIEANKVTHNEDIIEPKKERITPLFHQRPHVKAMFGLNTVIKIKANDPCEGQPALVEIHNLYDLVEDYLTNDPNYKLLREFPGPLIKDKTSKTSITQYCQKKVRECLNNTLLIDSSSYALIWEYLSLLVRQNGIIDLKTDISSLLLGETQNWSLNDNHHQMIIKQNNSQTTTPALFNNIDNDDLRSNTPNSEINSITENIQTININKKQNIQNMSEDEILMKLRELLANGQRGDAFEWSIKNNLLSHAFFIAITQQQQKQQQQLIINDNKLIERVKTKFINSFITQDPLKTCYQLYNGNSPTITTIPNLLCEWNDWRRHLAMIVSNQESYNNEKVIKSIKSMGDCLATNNRIAASHFCYLLANVQFGDFKKKSSKIVLIGSSHNVDSLDNLNDLSSFHATEIYEYATGFYIEPFFKFKLIYTCRLYEFGFYNEALNYMELIAMQINSNPSFYLDEISTAYKLSVSLRAYLFELQIQNGLPNVIPNWFIELENNFKSFICKNYNIIITRDKLKEHYQTTQVLMQQNNNRNINNGAPITPVSEAIDDNNLHDEDDDDDELKIINNKRDYKFDDQKHAKLPIKNIDRKSFSDTTISTSDSDQ